jgi:hypothetical protein
MEHALPNFTPSKLGFFETTILVVIILAGVLAEP